MTSQSTVPGFLDALVAAATNVLGTSVQIVDGDPRNNLTKDYLLLGWDETNAAVILDEARATAATTRAQETYTVVSHACAWAGTNNPTVLRQRVYGYVDSLATVLEADMTLGGTCAKAELFLSDYVTRDSSNGLEVDVRFTIHVEAFRRSNA